MEITTRNIISLAKRREELPFFDKVAILKDVIILIYSLGMSK
jgi:hypothetical protein